MNEAKIKACPFCGGQGEITVTTADTRIAHRHTVICMPPGCGASGQWADSPMAAIEAWNKRAGGQQPEAIPNAGNIAGSLQQHGYASLLAAAKRMVEDQRFDYFANTNCPTGQENDGVLIWNDLVAAIHAADPQYEA